MVLTCTKMLLRYPVVRAISQGITAPEELVKLIPGRIINHHGIDVIKASLKGVVSLAEIDMISQLRDELDMAEAHKENSKPKCLRIVKGNFPKSRDSYRPYSA